MKLKFSFTSPKLNFLFYVYKPAKASQQALQAAKYLQASVG